MADEALHHGLKEVDLVYFNSYQSEADEELGRNRIKKVFENLPLPVDVMDEARVHEWYPSKFGYEISAYVGT